MPELSYQEAVELYWRAASEEDPDSSVNQPSTPGSWREEGRLAAGERQRLPRLRLRRGRGL